VTETPNPNIIDADTLTGEMRPIRRAVLSLGSNLGERMDNLQGAVRALADTPDVWVTGVSPVYETEPVDAPDGSDLFLNAVVMADTTLAFGAPPTGTSTTTTGGDASPVVGGSCGRSMAAGSGREGRGGGDRAAAAVVGFSEILRAQWSGRYWFHPLSPLPPRTSRGRRPAPVIQNSNKRCGARFYGTC
jgi:hypothetical protein